MNRINFVLFIMIIGWWSDLAAQKTWIGSVYDISTSRSLADTEVIMDATILDNSDANGTFQIQGSPGSEIMILLFHDDYKVLDTLIKLDDRIEEYAFYLEPLSEILSEVQIKARRKEIFAVRQLRDVEGTTINAGKKTEVVVLENITANLATNLSRQIYAQVAGLNIYEGSDGGLQLAIGGRGLDPNRTANFNTRQNGYDISADVLGYPESYYSPPTNAVREIQIIRGASSLQYGTQFGGLINFRINELPVKKHWAAKTIQTMGSYGLWDSYNQISYDRDGLIVNAYYNYKRGDGYRDNSSFQAHNAYAKVGYKFNESIQLTGEVTYYNYLSQQAGGLTDDQFDQNPRLSTRERNWFDIDWKLFSLRYDHQLSSDSKLSVNLFALDAARKALGYRGNAYNINENPILALDEKNPKGNYINPRDLIVGNFKNYGLELRWINEFTWKDKSSVLLTGLKWYDASNTSRQGPGSLGEDADFDFRNEDFPDYAAQSDFRFPNKNLALFTEYIIYLKESLSITPGLRLEYINTNAIGTYNQVVFDNAGNPIANNIFDEDRGLKRSFILLGLGMEYKPTQQFSLYGNISQNYRSVTFSDIRVVSPSFKVDPEITDEKGYTFDLGMRGRYGRSLSYSLGTFGVLYQKRIGIIFDDRANRVRKNIGDAIILGTELFADFDLLAGQQSKSQLKPFINAAFTYSEYIRSENQNVKGKQVEFVPMWNWKTGLSYRYDQLKTSIQYTFLSSQYTDAQNSEIAVRGDLRSGIIGEIPAYGVLDLSAQYEYRRFMLSAGINNLLNHHYYTRRATGYPGPGIIPSDGRNLYFGIGWQL